MERNIGRKFPEHGGRGREGDREKLTIGDAAPDLSTGSDPNSDLLGNSVSKPFPGAQRILFTFVHITEYIRALC